MFPARFKGITAGVPASGRMRGWAPFPDTGAILREQPGKIKVRGLRSRRKGCRTPHAGSSAVHPGVRTVQVIDFKRGSLGMHRLFLCLLGRFARNMNFQACDKDGGDGDDASVMPEMKVTACVSRRRDPFQSAFLYLIYLLGLGSIVCTSAHTLPNYSGLRQFSGVF